MHHSYTIFCASLTLKYTKLVNTYKSLNYKPISYTSKTEDKIVALVNDLIEKIEQFYSIISDEDFSGLTKLLNNCKNEKSEESINKVIEEIKLIKDEKIKENIYYIFIKVFSK